MRDRTIWAGMTDWFHEQRIRAVLRLYLNAYRLQCWAGAKHRELIKGRSVRQVERMERERGLR